MIKIKILILFLFFFSFTRGQTNLVPNWSFEIDSLCPWNGSQIEFAPPWHSAGGNPDYYNACDGMGLTTAGVPLNWGGYQFAKTGDAYAGFFCYYILSSPPPVEAKEYLQVKLIDSLTTNRKYCISFYINLATTLAQTYHNVAITEMGMYISDTAVFRNDQLTLPFIPQIKSPVGVFLNDTLNWTEISGTYTAHGGEKYITIGNFNNPTDTFNMPNNNNNTVVVSYYFVDDVTVRDCTNDGVGELEDKEYFSLFPNPNNGNMTLDYKLDQGQTGNLTIYDITGKLVSNHKFNSAATSMVIDESNLNAGAYFYEIKVNDSKIKSDKLIIVK